MNSFKRYYIGIILRPERTFRALIDDDRMLRYGTMALSLNAVLYTVVYIFLTMGGGAPSSFAPWLAIPREVYYFYDQFIVAPSMILGWILAAGVAQTLSRLLSGKGSFEGMLSVFGFAISIACLASLLHDLPDSFLGAAGLLDLRWYEVALNTPTIWRTILLTLYTISILWFTVLFVKAVEAVQKIGRIPSIVVGIVSYAVYQLFFLVFNR